MRPMPASNAVCPMSEAALIAFLVEPVGPGATVIVIGNPSAVIQTALAQAAGPTGLAVTLAVRPARPGGPSPIRATDTAAPLRSHLADVVVVAPNGEPERGPAAAEEIRRLLAPGGRLRAVFPRADGERGERAAGRLAALLRRASLRDVELVRLGGSASGGTGIRARGPR